MVIPRSRTVRYGQRSYHSSAPSVWNDLPSKLKDTTLVVNVLSRALNPGFLIVPTCDKRFWELLFKGAI